MLLRRPPPIPVHRRPKQESTIKPPSPTRNTTTPAGLVARLMGLDSFPNSPKTTIMQKSRSVGSLDFILPNFHITKQPLHHRRVTTSLSFREVPTTFLHDLAKSDMGLFPIQENPINFKQRASVNAPMTNITTTTTNNNNKKNTIKKRQSVKVKNEEKEVSSVPLKTRRKRRVHGTAKKKLVDDGFPDEKNKYRSKSKRFNHPLPKMGKQQHDIRKEKKKPMLNLKRRECEYTEDYCNKVLREVCRLTMVEIEGSVWVDTKVASNNIQELSYEIGQQILQVLMYEMVHELCSSL
ncbi:hypothetical protein Hanom_Chr01g00037111 [Helianthus anomalus]